ncbi:MAG: hydroxyacylglutathione hydrolase [Stappiaceae bacterium]
MPHFQIHQFNCLQDNFGVLVHNEDDGTTLAIDVPEAGPVLEALSAKGWTLSDILITHHHADHVQGVAEVKEKTGARVYAPAQSATRIGSVDTAVQDGEAFQIGEISILPIATPGHTLDQISYYLPQANVAFTGDTLFALGCGRIFEGDAGMMWSSLERLVRELPSDTTIYCGHEYTLANAKFAVTVDPENQALRARLQEITQLRSADAPTLPTTMALELETNPFLRPQDPAVQKALDMTGAAPQAVFAEIRRRKDNF